MKFWSGKDIAEMIGITTIVASLVFVGIELKQSQEIAIADQYQARHDSLAEFYYAMMQSDAAMSIYGDRVLKSIESDSMLPDSFKTWAAEQPKEELAYRSIEAILALKAYDNVYFQYRSGFLPELDWRPMLHQLQWILDQPANWARGTYESDPEVWSESFRQLMDDLINKNELETR